MSQGTEPPVSPANSRPFAPGSGGNLGPGGLDGEMRTRTDDTPAPLGFSQGRGLTIVLGILGLLVVVFLGHRIFSRPGPLLWSSQPVVRFAAGQPAAFRIKSESASVPNKKGTSPAFRAPGDAIRGFRQSGTVVPSGNINPNTASHEELCELPGVGKVIAARIIAAREEKPFGRAEDLRRVQGIGAKTLERIRPQLTFGTDSPSEDRTLFNDGTNP